MPIRLTTSRLLTLNTLGQDALVSEAMAMLRALNKMTRAGMPKSVRIA